MKPLFCIMLKLKILISYLYLHPDIFFHKKVPIILEQTSVVFVDCVYFYLISGFNNKSKIRVDCFHILSHFFFFSPHRWKNESEGKCLRFSAFTKAHFCILKSFSQSADGKKTKTNWKMHLKNNNYKKKEVHQLKKRELK